MLHSVSPSTHRPAEYIAAQSYAPLQVGERLEAPQGPGERTRFFKSVGMGLFDLCVAEAAVAAAAQRGLGQTLGEA